jgi:hypothetical protein
MGKEGEGEKEAKIVGGAETPLGSWTCNCTQQGPVEVA